MLTLTDLTTTYGPIPAARALIERVKAVHERVRGKTDDGTPYRASDPHLLEWVHLTETQSFLASFQHFGDRRLSRAEGTFIGPSRTPRQARIAARIPEALAASTIGPCRTARSGCRAR